MVGNHPKKKFEIVSPRKLNDFKSHVLLTTTKRLDLEGHKREEVARAKALEREEAARLKAERALKAARAPRRRESRRDQVSTAAESVEARQTESHPARGGRREEVSSPNFDMQAQQRELSFFNEHPATYASPSHGQFVFNHPFHQFVAPLQSTMSSQPSAMLPHLSAMPQFILPIQLQDCILSHGRSLLAENNKSQNRRCRPAIAIGREACIKGSPGEWTGVEGHGVCFRNLGGRDWGAGWPGIGNAPDDLRESSSLN